MHTTYRLIPILLFTLVLAGKMASQQIPFLNYYTWNPRLFNPAHQGIDGNGEFVAVYRSQFQQLDAADRPNTYMFHADFSPLFNERIGLAGQVMGDKTHILSKFQLSGFFGYHIIQDANLRLSLGASASLLSQNFDFEGLRLSDIVDLSVFNGQSNASRFDGGPGLAFEYRLPGGSFVSLDAAATQLFSSDIPIDGPNDSSQRSGLYDVIPHALVNVRFYYQGAGFGLEPNIAYRALAGKRKLKYGLFDFNLNSYFLKDNRLMVGAGIRTDQGGLHIQFGITPTTSLRLIASAELHSQLGTSYEVGASYTFGRILPKAPTPATANTGIDKNLIEDLDIATMELAKQFEDQAETVREQQNINNATITTNAPIANYQKRLAASDSCAAQLQQISKNLGTLRQLVSGIDVKRLQAEQQVRNASSQGGSPSPTTLASLKAIQARSANINTQFDVLNSEYLALVQRCETLRPLNTQFTCIQKGDADCVRDFFTEALNSVSGKPTNIYPLRIFSVPAATAVTYHYPDDAETYLPSIAQKALADHLIEQIRQLEAQGVKLDNLTLITELQEDNYTLGYNLNLQYGGELGELPLSYTLVNNIDGKSNEMAVALPNGSLISLEALGVLKLHALKKYFIEQGIAAGQISLEVRYNHTSNIYREETKMILRLRS